MRISRRIWETWVDSCLWKKRDLEMDYAKSCFLSFLTILAQTTCSRAQRMANTMTGPADVWLNEINVPGAISSGEGRACACRERVPPRSRQDSSLPLIPFAIPRAFRPGSERPFHVERSEDRRTVARSHLSGFQSASKRSCKQTVRAASATCFRLAHCV